MQVKCLQITEIFAYLLNRSSFLNQDSYPHNFLEEISRKKEVIANFMLNPKAQPRVSNEKILGRLASFFVITSQVII